MASEPPATFPLSIVVFCDRCGVEVRHDYLVHDMMTRDERLGVAREHMARNEDWSCTAGGDFCPACKPDTVCACGIQRRYHAEDGTIQSNPWSDETCDGFVPAGTEVDL